MPTIDGGHYFLTTMMPVKVAPLKCPDGSFTSPSHLLRQQLASLPTAQHSPACVAAGFSSPFSRCTRTHFVRAVVIDQPMYNGRDPDNALRQSLRNVNLLAHQPVDRLSCPYLMFCADFDARAGESDGGLESWATGLWSKTEPELRAVFAHCWGFDTVGSGPEFAAWLRRCQLKTTMSFNDYYVPTAVLEGYTLKQLATGVAGGTVALTGLAAWGLRAQLLSGWWLAPIALAAAAASVAIALLALWRKGSRPFPQGAGTDLPSILKSLYVQQRFALLAAELQGADASTLQAGFAKFLADVCADSVAAPTQSPGVIRSDDIAMVEHQRVKQTTVVA